MPLTKVEFEQIRRMLSKIPKLVINNHTYECYMHADDMIYLLEPFVEGFIKEDKNEDEEKEWGPGEFKEDK